EVRPGLASPSAEFEGRSLVGTRNDGEERPRGQGRVGATHDRGRPGDRGASETEEGGAGRCDTRRGPGWSRRGRHAPVPPQAGCEGRGCREERRQREVEAGEAEIATAPTATGLLDVLPEGYGFLRTSGYLPGPEDIYVSLSQVRRFMLRKGDTVTGKVRQPKD